jgi:hypothetical protein
MRRAYGAAQMTQTAAIRGGHARSRFSSTHHVSRIESRARRLNRRRSPLDRYPSSRAGQRARQTAMPRTRAEHAPREKRRPARVPTLALPRRLERRSPARHTAPHWSPLKRCSHQRSPTSRPFHGRTDARRDTVDVSGPRRFRQADQTRTAKSNGTERRFRWRHTGAYDIGTPARTARIRRRRAGTRRPLAPAFEKRTRRIRIDPGRQRSLCMFAKICQHISESIPHLARRSQRMPVPTVGPEAPPSPEQIIHVARHANCHAAHAGRERLFTTRLHYQMEAVVLNRILNHAERARITPIGTRNRNPNRGKQDWLRNAPSRARSVTCTGSVARCIGRARCGVIPRAAARLRPAPRRVPPRRDPSRARTSASSSCCPRFASRRRFLRVTIYPIHSDAVRDSQAANQRFARNHHRLIERESQDYRPFNRDDAETSPAPNVAGLGVPNCRSDDADSSPTSRRATP